MITPNLKLKLPFSFFSCYYCYKTPFNSKYYSLKDLPIANNPSLYIPVAHLSIPIPFSLSYDTFSSNQLSHSYIFALASTPYSDFAISAIQAYPKAKQLIHMF